MQILETITDCTGRVNMCKVRWKYTPPAVRDYGSHVYQDVKVNYMYRNVNVFCELCWKAFLKYHTLNKCLRYITLPVTGKWFLVIFALYIKEVFKYCQMWLWLSVNILLFLSAMLVQEWEHLVLETFMTMPETGGIFHLWYTYHHFMNIVLKLRRFSVICISDVTSK